MNNGLGRGREGGLQMHYILTSESLGNHLGLMIIMIQQHISNVRAPIYCK